MAKVVIIGGGVSGLSAGIYARLQGHRAIIAERHFLPGGNLTGWDREGYHIDNCIHWLTGTNPATSTYKMWEELGALGNVEVIYGNSLYTYERDGRSISLYRDLNKLKSEMHRVSPADKKEINSLISTVEILQGVFGIYGKKHKGGLSVGKLLKTFPSLVKYYKLSAGDLAKKFKDPLLSGFVSSFFGEDFASLALLFVFAHFCADNGGIPRGGSTAMAEKMAERFRSLGGELLLRREVVRIECRNGKAQSVLFSDGTSIEADYVIVTADPEVAFDKLIDAPMPSTLAKKYRDPRLVRFSSYQCAFALDMEKVPFEGDLIFHTPEELKKSVPVDKVILREFSHEPSFAPEGKNILQTMTFVSEEIAKGFIRLRNRSIAAYMRQKRRLADMMMRLIVGRFPEMEGKLRCIDVWTPATYRRFTDTGMGSWMSFALPKKTLPLRDGNRVPGLSNLILATQWQQIPGGLPIAAECGKIAAKTVTALEKRAAARIKAKKKAASMG